MATLGRSNEGSTEPRISFPEQSEGAVLAELTSLELYQHAAQPDVVLSQQRDVYYSNSLLGESISELMETFLGSRRTTILAPELKALASCLYFGLTNLAGRGYVSTCRSSVLLCFKSSHCRAIRGCC